MKPWPLAVIGAAAALSACAADYPAPPPPGPPVASAAPLGDSCFRSGEIKNHRVADDRTLYLRIANRDVFRLEMSAACLGGVGPSDPIVIREAGGAAYACQPNDLDVSVARNITSGGVPTPCIVQSMTRLSADEVAALPDRLRP